MAPDDEYPSVRTGRGASEVSKLTAKVVKNPDSPLARTADAARGKFDPLCQQGEPDDYRPVGSNIIKIGDATAPVFTARIYRHCGAYPRRVRMVRSHRPLCPGGAGVLSTMLRTASADSLASGVPWLPASDSWA